MIKPNSRVTREKGIGKTTQDDSYLRKFQIRVITRSENYAKTHNWQGRRRH